MASPFSSSSSFHSALDMPLNGSADSSTAPNISTTPQTGPSFPANPSLGPRPLQARALPYELCEQLAIYFEEGLYIQALSLLSNLLGSASNDSAFVPPPSHLSLICTLGLHPRYTTRAKTPDRLIASNAALAYLQALQRTVDPLEARLSEAYAYSDHGLMRRSTGTSRRRGLADERDSPDVHAGEVLQADLAQQESLFKRADSFWAAAGWAFNCSILHPKRWARWRLWLEHTIQVLEKDWEVRKAKADDTGVDWCSETLLARYCAIQGGERKIVRAAFADGSSRSLSEFPEVWKSETKMKQRTGPEFHRPAKKVDIDEGEFGDYMQSSSEDEPEGEGASNEEAPTQVPEALDVRQTQSFPSGSAVLGGSEALTLRMRLLALLSKLAHESPEALCGLQTLFDAYLIHIRPLSLPTFLAFLAPQALDLFHPDVASGFVQYLARSFLEPAAPTSTGDLDWGIIAKYYAPWAAAGQGAGGVVGENGKVSGCLEALVGITRKEVGPNDGLESRTSVLRGDRGQSKKDGELLWGKIEEGCQRRQERARSGGKRKRKGEAGGERSAEQEKAIELTFLAGARDRLRLSLGSDDKN